MYTDTEGIIFKQVKTINGRRMVLLFSKKYGKISAGTGFSEKGKGKSALAMRPFTYGKYELFKSRDSYNINGTEVIKSYYKIGENVEKYMFASYALEFTERMTVEGKAEPKLFDLLIEFLTALEVRSQKYETLVIAYQIKAMNLMGTGPQLSSCVICGEKESICAFSVKDGGVICEKCRKNMEPKGKGALIYNADFGIVNILEYFLVNSIGSLGKMALQEDSLKLLQEIIKAYAACHLDISELKSESFLPT